MPDPPRLHLNEHISPRLASQLRAYGFDVTSTQELSLRTASDAEQFATAVDQQRAIVTFNVNDFTYLHGSYMESGIQHWGIVFSTVESVDVLRHRLLRLLNSVSANDLKNQMRWLNDFR